MPFNSTIKASKGLCIDCNDFRERYLTAGRCSFHYKLYRQKVSGERKKTQSKPSIITGSELVTDLNLWFSEKIKLVYLNPKCMECNAWIPLEFYIASIAHIFPKAIFDSVKTAPLNYLILGAGCGCHDKTHRLDTFSKMRVFPIAIERFRTFENQIQEHHKYLSTFLEYVNSYKFQIT